MTNINPKILIVPLHFFCSKCNSQWENCLGPDENYLREETDYYGNIDTCPSYNPDERSDSYPGQPFFDDVENTKTNSYPPNPYIYNPPVPYVHSDNRRVGEATKASTGTCRHWINNGDGYVCDENIEIRTAAGKVVKANLPLPCNPQRDGCDLDDFTRL